MIVSEVFESIQGEGKYVGHPSIFIRIQGCNLRCDFCDSKYTWNPEEGKKVSVKKLVDLINDSDLYHVVWTGGEPLLQKKEIYKVIKETEDYKFHSLETNGILLDEGDFNYFDYISISPKDISTAERIRKEFLKHFLHYDVKVVTDLKKVNVGLVPYASMLMPLTVFDDEKDRRVERSVWEYCVKNNLKYSPRIHVRVWGNKRGV